MFKQSRYAKFNRVCITVFLCVLCPLCISSTIDYTVDDHNPPVYDLAAFLSEMNLSFNEYVSLVTQFEHDGVYTYYIEEKAAGYTWFLQNSRDIPDDAAIAYVNVRLDFGAYSKITDVPDPEVLTVLVNKNHILPQAYMPDDLMYVQGYSYRLRKDAAEQYLLMKKEMEDEGLNLYVVSAYRSYNTQRNLHRNAISSAGGVSRADEEVAREGHSEHQTGLAVDVLHRSYGGRLANANFQDTDEFAWLKTNAHKYGFILRYPEEYTDIHGYMYEPWHWRYVGADVATAMYDNEITVYEHFVGKYLTSDVLLRARDVILDARAKAEAAEAARIALEREEAEKRAALEAEAARKATEATDMPDISDVPDANPMQNTVSETVKRENSTGSVDVLRIADIPCLSVVIITIAAIVVTLETVALYKTRRDKPLS